MTGRSKIPASCANCLKKLSRRNRTGLCLTCFNKDPASTARRAAGTSRWRKKQMLDPKFAEAARAHGRWLGNLRMGASAAPAGSEPRRRMGRTMTELHLGWCPEEYRDEYRRLLHRNRYTAERAKAAILSRIEADRLNALAMPDNLQDAVFFLRRFAMIVRRGESYVYGTVELSPSQLLRRALDKGWKPSFARAA